MKFLKSDCIPMWEDAGLDATILSAFNTSISLQDLVDAVNAAVPLTFTASDLALYISDRGGLGLTVTGGSLRPPTPRLRAPEGLVADATGVWFDSPAEGVVMVRWYVNGEVRLEEERDLESNRYCALSAIGAVGGDIVQIAFVAGDMCGWWGRIQV